MARLAASKAGGVGTSISSHSPEEKEEKEKRPLHDGHTFRPRLGWVWSRLVGARLLSKQQLPADQQTSRQADKQASRQADKQTSRQADKQTIFHKARVGDP